MKYSFVLTLLLATTLSAWTPVKEWKGTSTKTTETFAIAGKEWRIRWKMATPAKEGVLSILIYNENKKLVGAAGGPDTDETYVKEGPGRFYLQILAIDVNWTITIDDAAS